MFGKLKEKLKNWSKSLSKSAEEKETEEPKEKEPENIGVTREIEVSVSDKDAEKPEKTRKERRAEKKAKKQIAKEEKKKESEILTLELEETETISEIIEPEVALENITANLNDQLLGKSLGEGIKNKLEENKEEKPSEPETPKSEKLEKPKEEQKEKKSFLSKFAPKPGKVKISEKEFWSYAEDLEMLLLENNVAFEVAEKIIAKLKERIVDKEFLKKEIEFIINDSLKDIIYELLIEPFDLVEEIKKFKDKNLEKKPFVILFCGINGTGKTTTIAKLVYLLKKNNLTSVIAAGDTFRAASIEQLNKHGERLDTKIISHDYGSDPASVGFDAIKYAEKNKIDVVLIDTAGRMHTEKNLMAQIEKVAKVTQPNLKIFVGESITGNDIVEQIQAFNESVKIDGIILSKADIDEKGGTALSVGATTGKPILYLGTGQNYEDLEPFNRTKFVEKLGLGE